MSSCSVSVSTFPQLPWLVLLEVFWLLGKLACACMCFENLHSNRLARIPPWGIASMEIHTWRNIFFFEGLFTVIVGLGAPFLMPRSPTECWFLNERERMIATQRLVSRSGADENEKVEVHHVKRAMLNITNYFCAMGFFFINITVQGISLFMVST
jgi:adenylosuccinate synthase